MRPRALHRWIWAGLLLVVGVGLARLRLDVEVLNLLPPQLPVAQGLILYQKHFSDARELIVTVEAPTPEETETCARAFAHLVRQETNLVANVVWQPAWQEHPADATELLAYLWLNQPPAAMADLARRLTPTNLPAALAETRERLATSLSPADLASAGYDPFGLLRLPASASAGASTPGSGDEIFMSPDGTMRLVFVEARPDIVSYRACRTWLQAMRDVVTHGRRSGQIPPNAHLRFTGRPAFVTEIAGGMENDTAGSATGTLATIGVLFWLAHRRFRPLFWLLFVLVVILASTTAIGCLLLGQLNVVSIGFASILLGLAEDFGIVIYQESRSHPEFDQTQLQRAVAPGIFWSAVTTAGAFLTLNLSTLPGLRQLGSLVALGIILAAIVMPYAYLPFVLRLRRPRDLQSQEQQATEKYLLFAAHRLAPAPWIWTMTLLLLVVSAGILAVQGPRLDYSPNVFRPKNSEAATALDEIKVRFGRNQSPLWVLATGTNETLVAERLAKIEGWLERMTNASVLSGHRLPTPLWPQPANQAANRAAAAALANARPELHAAALAAGFTTNALAVTDSILDTWQRAASTTAVLWPTNASSRWILGKLVSRTDQGWAALGMLHPANNTDAVRALSAEWPASFSHDGIILTGWELLGTTVFDRVVVELPRVLLPIFLLVVLSLWLAFRNWREVSLSLAILAFSALLLGALMNLLRWDWNILNLMALPLLLGMGVDFSIHIQLALRRYHGDLLAVRRSVGRALLLAGATTVAGFGSLAFSSNAGMASLGKVCALGITLALVVAVHLLPTWWKAWMRPATPQTEAS